MGWSFEKISTKHRQILHQIRTQASCQFLSVIPFPLGPGKTNELDKRIPSLLGNPSNSRYNLLKQSIVFSKTVSSLLGNPASDPVWEEQVWHTL